MKKLRIVLATFLVASMAHANNAALTVYQDPNCGCCTGWAEHMRESGFEVNQVKTRNMASVKSRLGVPVALGSCHTAVMDATGQVIEGHVPASVVRKLLSNPSMKGVAAPGMPANAPGMGELDGNLVTVDFQGRPFSRD
ncbi:MAG: CopG family transcriptional regulator [Pusillimonas sp.]|nr:CopG family transcriptional regulator [Pusillimonas sp.]MBC41735.1 CopG family transcriptional regulator [Pusillimonas sp.]HCN71165.1 CopG family transcriptional regulator [Pusillimonas sp.]HCP77751.1 CopG family transcriptional regulator [Pusillimonas sp.]